MYKDTFKGSFKSWFGKPLTELKTPDGTLNTVAKIAFAGSYDCFGVNKDSKLYTEDDWAAAYAEIEAAGKLPKVSDIVDFVNGKELNKQRQAAMAAQVAAHNLVQPTTANDADLRLKKMIGLYIDNGMSEEDATEEAIESLKRADAKAAKRAAEKAE